MQIQVNTDHNIEGHEALANDVTGTVKSALSRFSDHITRVAIHLSDANWHKSSRMTNTALSKPDSKAASPSPPLTMPKPCIKL